MSQDSTDVLLKKIEAVAKINDEIIVKINERKIKKSFSCNVEQVGHPQRRYILNEEVVEEPVADLTKAWEFKGTKEFVTDVWDIFNDHVDYNATSFTAICALNKTLLEISKKFKLFDKNNEAAVANLTKYLKNLEVVQTALGSVDELTMDDKSHLDEIRAQFDIVNEHLAIGYSLLSKYNPLFDPANNFGTTTLLNKAMKAQLKTWFPGSWTLLFKATRDGFGADRFHALCDNKGATITVVASLNGCVFGGYAAVPWDCQLNGYAPDARAALFSLKTLPGMVNHGFEKLDNRESGANAIFSSLQYGPTFGGGPDLCLSSGCNVNNQSYMNPITYWKGSWADYVEARNFKVADYEVFGIATK